MFTSTYVVSTVATYSCDPGYGLSGGDTARTCGGDGSTTTGVWDGMMPTCQRTLIQGYYISIITVLALLSICVHS